MERIGVATLLHRANGQTSSGSFATRERAEPSQEEIANEHGPIHVCILRQNDRMGSDRLVSMCASGQKAASTHRQGNTGGSLGQSESFATTAHPLLRGQSLGRETSDGKSREQNLLRLPTGTLHDRRH